ncbi:MAG: discoidin domain-containing protein, partial [Spirochaetes bacterium]|nr:discoidin domain-containing protein [Spirochaetota bacterium]
FLGSSTTNYYFVPACLRVGTESDCTIAVEAVSKEYGFSPSSSSNTAIFEWEIHSTPEKCTTHKPNDGSLVGRVVDLSWNYAYGASSYDVYLGKQNELVYIGNTTKNYLTTETLEYSSEYYWRVDSRNAFGTTTGDEWYFQTISDSMTPIDRTDNPGGTVTARGENLPNEGMDKAFDNDINTKWLDFSASSWIQFQFTDQSSYIVTEYRITSANDADNRDPFNWTLSGSHDGKNWIVIDTRNGEDFPNRFQTRSFWIDNLEAFEYYRFDMENNNGNILQLAEIELMDYYGDVVIPETAANLWPQNNVTDIGIAERLSWTKGNHSDFSRIYISENPTFTAEDIVIETPAEYYYPENLKPNTQYFWRVDAVNILGATEGETWNFTTAAVHKKKIKLTFDDFENGFGNFKSDDEQCIWVTDSDYAHSGESSIKVQGNSSFSLLNAIDTSDYEKIIIKFGFLANNMNENDYFEVQYFDGNIWQTIKSYQMDSDIKNAKYYHKKAKVNVKGCQSIDSLSIRFIGFSSSTAGSFYFDDIKLSAKYPKKKK